MLPADLGLVGYAGQKIKNGFCFERGEKERRVRRIEKSPWAVQY
jgi:hypothetical protein